MRLSGPTDEELINNAASVINPKMVGDRLFGDVGCALLSRSGNLYLGVCIDTASGTGPSSCLCCMKGARFARAIPSERSVMPSGVVELRSEEEVREAFSVVRQLHGALNERKYMDLLSRMVPNGYRMFAVREPSGEVAAVLGMQVLINLYYERHAYVYDLVASETSRSKGYGGLLMDHVEALARREGCSYVALACGREREEALRFYEERGYERPGYSMRKSLR